MSEPLQSSGTSIQASDTIGLIATSSSFATISPATTNQNLSDFTLTTNLQVQSTKSLLKYSATITSGFLPSFWTQLSKDALQSTTMKPIGSSSSVAYVRSMPQQTTAPMVSSSQIKSVTQSSSGSNHGHHAVHTATTEDIIIVCFLLAITGISIFTLLLLITRTVVSISQLYPMSQKSSHFRSTHPPCTR